MNPSTFLQFLKKKLYPLEQIIFYLLILFLPTQLGKHFWPSFSYVLGIRIDYLSPTLYFTDVLILILLILSIVNSLNNRKKRSNIKYQRSNRKTNHSSLRGVTTTKQSSLLMKIAAVASGDLAMTLRKFFRNLKFLLIATLLIIGIMLSGNPLAGLYGLIKIIEFAFFGFYVSTKIKKLDDIKNVGFIFSFGVLFESILVIAQYFNQSSIGSIFYFFGERTFNSQTPGIANASLNGELVLRPYGTFSHPNVLAAYLIISMITIIFSGKAGLIFSSKGRLAFGQNHFLISKFKNIFFGFSIFVGTAALLLTMSRTAIIIWIFVVGYFIACYLKNNIKNKFTIYYLIFAIFIIGSVLILSPIHNRFTSFSFYDESITIRKELVLNSLIIIKERPLFGVGINNFLINLPDYQKINTGSFFTYLQPVHNIFLLVASETGVAGFIIFIWFIYKTVLNLKTQNSKLPPAIAYASPLVKRSEAAGAKQWRAGKSTAQNLKLLLLMIILILGVFDHYFLTLQQGQLLFSFVLGLCWAQIKIDSKSKIRDNKISK